MLLIIAGFLEFILGNTFPFMVFMGYGISTPAPTPIATHNHNELTSRQAPTT